MNGRVYVSAAYNQGEDVSLRKALPQDFAGHYFFHPQFGLVSEDALHARLSQKSRSGFRMSRVVSSECAFTLTPDFELNRCENCDATGSPTEGWTVRTPRGVLHLHREDPRAIAAPQLQILSREEDTGFRKIFLLSLLISGGLLGGLSLWRPAPNNEITAAQEKLIIRAVKVARPPVTTRPMNTATATEQAPRDVVQPKNVAPNARKALPQALGFLGMVGSKDLKRALGGVPTTPGASPGAGSGGTEGSGGQMLVGLGQGVRRTTVGNSGVEGLGGVGTKGKGGGGGGYGTALVGAGDGKSALSKLALSEDIVLDGGLDRATINATIAKYLSEVRACYEKGLAAQPGLEGQVNMQFEIGAVGALNSAQVAKSSLGGGAPAKGVESCISRRMLAWKFPKPVGGVNVKVNYPFVLRPVGS